MRTAEEITLEIKDMEKRAEVYKKLLKTGYRKPIYKNYIRLKIMIDAFKWVLSE